jgi:hypothetical protein
LADLLAVVLGIFVSVFTGETFGADDFSGAATHLVSVAVETGLNVDFAGKPGGLRAAKVVAFGGFWRNEFMEFWAVGQAFFLGFAGRAAAAAAAAEGRAYFLAEVTAEPGLHLANLVEPEL